MSSHPLWNHSLAQRLALLRKGTYRVAYLAPKPDLGTFRYRAFNPTEALKSSSTHSASYFFYSDLALLDDLSSWADALVLVRAPYDQRLDSIYRQFRNVGKKVYFDIDDLVFDSRYATLVASNLGYELQEEELNQWSAFISNTGLALSRADEIITTNDYLAARIRDFVELPIHVVPNTFNSYQHTRSEALPVRTPGPQGLSLGYFSGSHSHVLDFGVVASALVAFLSHSPHSRLTVVGHLALPAELETFTERITRLPFMDFLELQQAICEVDVNIVPLQSSDFTSGKSELKYFEAGLVSTPTLASRTPVFEAAISEGKTGFLADSGTWLDRLHEIEGFSPERRQAVGEAARLDAHKRYSPESLVEHLTAVFGQEK